MKGSKTLILGAGVGGIAAATTLRSMLPREHEITLVDKGTSFHLGLTKTWVMLGEKTTRQVTRSLDGLKKRGIRLIHADIQRIDAAKREVLTNAGPLTADYLVIALGADLNMGAVDGLKAAAQTFYHMDGAVRLRDTLKKFRGGEVVVLVPKAPFKCPPAPYEGAMLLNHLFVRRGIQHRLSVFTVEGAPMATAGPEIGKFVRDSLSERKIAYSPLKKTKSVDSKRVLFEDGTDAAYDLLIAIPPHEAPAVVRESGLSNQSGWIPVDAKTLKLAPGDSGGRVFAIGDCTVCPLPGRFKPENPLVLPKAGTFAEGQGKIVAARIAADILGREPADLYGGKGFCYVEMGDQHAVRTDGSFFDLPHPTMSFNVPDMDQFHEKRRWAAEWMHGYLG